MIEELLFFTNAQKVLSFLIENPEKEYFDREISKLTGISKAGTNFALRSLAQQGIILREKRGRMYFYRVLSNDVFIKHLKILQNIAILRPLIKKLKEYSLKITLYGSAAKGENYADSDIDIFIMSRDIDEVKDIMFKDELREKIQYIVHTPLEYVKSKENNFVFYDEVEKGIVLWKENEFRV